MAKKSDALIRAEARAKRIRDGVDSEYSNVIDALARIFDDSSPPAAHHYELGYKDPDYKKDFKAWKMRMS